MGSQNYHKNYRYLETRLKTFSLTVSFLYVFCLTLLLFLINGTPQISWGAKGALRPIRGYPKKDVTDAPANRGIKGKTNANIDRTHSKIIGRDELQNSIKNLGMVTALKANELSQFFELSPFHVKALLTSPEPHHDSIAKGLQKFLSIEKAHQEQLPYLTHDLVTRWQALSHVIKNLLKQAYYVSQRVHSSQMIGLSNITKHIDTLISYSLTHPNSLPLHLLKSTEAFRRAIEETDQGGESVTRGTLLWITFFIRTINKERPQIPKMEHLALVLNGNNLNAKQFNQFLSQYDRLIQNKNSHHRKKNQEGHESISDLSGLPRLTEDSGFLESAAPHRYLGDELTRRRVGRNIDRIDPPFGTEKKWYDRNTDHIVNESLYRSQEMEDTLELF
ncbi:MAG: hypothetical protein NZ480_02950 [Bdellovibrionaceae bacterium]|nr:hypothetical protein [Pseudobdellovibrionaceae bacterium]MDW8191198.1 hypothetical protein [Pseudobdellovibrionaceae bacterium]